MIKHRVRPALCRSLISLAVAIPAVVTAAPPSPPRSPTPATDAAVPSAAAQAQIARLRQAAEQLRLLSAQPQPTNAAPTEHEEHARHRQWLYEAQERVRILADNWEQRLTPGTQQKGVAPTRDVNAFFAAQTAGLQSRLDRESAANDYRSPLVRAARDTARVVIGHMY